ncbi:hypothetical protein D3OALGA1CA_3319 [Olavius algarvensis associated proteobacterium Delta 3]|nr:hypothetical protein D3OALGB2SA_1440 [Olavius algarvensis associated proteobacterium Delta 3]CAB5132506.1 hypothetical protein D3OALGA1CA_3319 [Olavius algarvensis associated proteobacterium Delta 3]
MDRHKLCLNFRLEWISTFINKMRYRYTFFFLAVVLIIATGCYSDFFDYPDTLTMLAKIDKCEFDYNKVLEEDPENFFAVLCRGKAFYKEGNYSQAVSDFTKAIEIDKRSFHAYFYRGTSYGIKGLYDLAISDFTKAIEIYPTSVRTYSNRGRAYACNGQYDMAIFELTKCIELSPKNAIHYSNLAWILATCPDAKYRDGREAVDLAKKALSITSDSCGLDSLAAAYAEIGKYQEAVKIQEQCIYQLESEGEKGRLDELNKRLKQYKNNKPWREYQCLQF